MLLALLLAPLGLGADLPALANMPRTEDYTLMSWAEGFPSHLPAAPWRRVIETGRYAFALDTETLRVSHFGALKYEEGYAAAARSARNWESLPSADLSLNMTVAGKRYHCAAGGKWTRFTGPRLIDSGRFVQKADVTNLEFAADDGAKLNVEARFETLAWPDRLALILSARPGAQAIPAGEKCFGRVGGGFGLDGANHLEVPHSPELDSEQLTLELWAFVPMDYRASERVFPWLACKNQHEQAQGNYGIVILNGRAQARINIGGGRENQFAVDSQKPLKMGEWNHFVMSYDGDNLRLALNGESAGKTQIGRPRVPGRGGLAFGRRQDNSGDGYHYRGAVDEIRFYDHALTPEEIKARYQHPEKDLSTSKPVRQWSFAIDGKVAMTRPSETWSDATMEMRFATAKGELKQRWDLPKGESWTAPQWHEVALAFDPVAFEAVSATSPIAVAANEVPSGKARAVSYEAVQGWHRVDLDGIEPIIPPGPPEKGNDAMERVKLVLTNPADTEQVARLLFDKTQTGFRQHFGAVPTGISAMLRDANGQPTGIPVQLSKDWHNDPAAGVYSGMWFHGYSLVRLPPKGSLELEFTLVYGHWGGVAAASHAQLSLIGWGSNQLWDQSALGCWGESICYEPDQVQGECSILDVRPVMVASMNHNARWGWTNNVGGGDFFRFFDKAGQRIAHSAVKTAYERHGPCLTEVTYAGRIGAGVEHHETVSLVRTDDIVRGTYRVRLDVRKPMEFSRFVLFQIGADTYNYTGERKMALGNESGLLKEWSTQWGGDAYRTVPFECTGRLPWISMHEGSPQQKGKDQGAWANRGIIVRSWKAKLGGKDAAPWIAEHGVNARSANTSTVDVLPPPSVTRLEAGDFVEATFEHVIMPQSAEDYYGPNEGLRTALKADGNTWRMIQREATGNDRRIEMRTGKLSATQPSVSVQAIEDKAEFTLTGGLGYVPMTFTGLTDSRGYTLTIDDQPVNQSVHGNDFWQTDFDPKAQRWSLTFNMPIDDRKAHKVGLIRK